MSFLSFLEVLILLLCCSHLVTSKTCEDKMIKKGLDHVTIVTALYDIGRGNWTRFKKSFHEFLADFKQTLQLRVNLIVFCDKSISSFVKKHRCACCSLHVIEMPFHKLEFFSYRPFLIYVMSSSDYKDDNYYLGHPEGFSPDYVLLMSNKISFLKIATELNIFNSTHFFWLDAGYGHGNLTTHETVKSGNVLASSDNIFNLNDKITYIALNDIKEYEGVFDLQKVSLPPAVAGGFFGGNRKSVLEYYHIYRKVFRGKLPDFVADDDQSYAVYSYFEIPRLFNLIRGDWFDAYKYL